MKFYVLEYDLNSENPNEASILWETESESLTEARNLASMRPGCDYDVVSEINIKNQAQLIEIEVKKAQIRVQEAKGIAESQKIIDTSLTTNYLQYLAIGAQREMAHSQNHTQIYIPSGANGIPLVKTLNA